MSGSTIGSVVGGVIGFVVGGPAGARWGIMIGGTVGGAVAPGTIKGPSIGDAQQQTSEAGAPRPVVFGHPAPFAGNLIDGEKKARKRTKKTKQGKGGPTVKTEQFLLTSAIRVCEGPIAGFIRIWEDGVCVYDARSTFPPGWEGYSSEVRTRQARWLANAALYLGTEDQMPDPELEAIHGVGNTPYYRGTAYIRVKDADRTATKGTAARYMFEVAAAGDAGVNGLLGLAPVGYWPLDESAGTTATDHSGNGNHGTYVGNYAHSPAFTANSAGCLECVDQTGGVAIANADILDVGENSDTWAVCASFVVDSFSGDGTVLNQIVTNWGNSALGYHNWSLYLDPSTHLPTASYTKLNTAPNGAQGSTPVAIDDVHRMWGVRDGDEVRLYLDGALHATAAAVAGQYSWPGGANGIRIGAATLSSASYGFIGRVSDVAVFDYAVTAAQIADDAAYFVGLNSATQVPMPDSLGGIWDLLRRSIILDNAEYITFTPDEGVSLATVEAAIAARCNVPASKVDFSALAGITIPGFLVTDQPTGADTLQPLMQANFHDLPEVDDQIVARLRGGPVVASFTDDDLIDSGEDSENETRPQQMEFPAKVSVVTQDPDADYSPIPQVSYRYSPSINATSEVVLQVPIPYPADDAARIAHKAHKVLWSNAEAVVERVLPEEYSRLVVSDPVEYDDRRWLVDDRQYFDGEVKLRLKYERASDYESEAAGQAVDPPEPPDSSVLGPTVLFAANLPSLRAEDNIPGIYIVAGGVVPGYPGCDVYLSTDGGLTEQLVLTIPASQASVMGELVDDEPSGGEPLTIRLYNAEDILENASAAQVLQGANAAMLLDSSGEAEVVGFEGAAETTSEDWEITTITRGGLGTTEIPRVAGDKFSLLESAYFLPIDPALAGETLILRGVTIGTVVDANPTFSLVFQPGDIIVDGGGDPL